MMSRTKEWSWFKKGSGTVAGTASRVLRTTAAEPFLNHDRRAYSLLELLAVMALLGILALAAVANFRPETFGNISAKVDARRVALDLMQARRRAIATGDNHFLSFQTSGGITTYEIYRRLSGGGTAAVDAVRTIPKNVSVSVAPSTPEFNFEGQALAANIITFTGPNRSWQITVAQATGSVSVTEL